ncbi:MAG: M48 family metalloprotease [Colwellia sp.]
MKRSLIVILIIVLLFACKSTGLKIGNIDVGKLVDQGNAVWDANNIDEQDEIQFGKNMSAVLLGARPLHPNEKLNIYVNKVGMWLASNTTRPNLPWHFGVINSSAINAFAAPGGYVFITSGMLMQLDNEAQLAAVLAHEIMHVVAQHHLNALKEGSMRSAITEVLFVSADMYQSNTGASQQDKKYSAWAKSITGAAQELYSKGLNKEDEYQADQLGIRLLAKSGYDPFAFIDNLQLLASIAPDDSSLALLYKTHPEPSQRLKALENQLESLQAIEGELLANRFSFYTRGD